MPEQPQLDPAQWPSLNPRIRISVNKLMTAGDDRCELVFEEE